MNDSMNDPRKETRKKLMAFTPVYDSATRALLGYIGNINLHGVMVVSEHGAETGKDITLNIELPNGLLDTVDKNLLMPAHIAWCKSDESVKSFTIGFEFTKTTSEQEATIQAILDRYHFRYSS